MGYSTSPDDPTEGPGNWHQPSNTRLFWRGLTKRCPACGDRKLFDRWVKIHETCANCGLRFERIEGHWIGAIGINTIVSFGAVLITAVVGMIATFPDFPVLPLIAATVAVAVIVPVLFFPVSQTLWTGIDIALRPLEPFEVDWTKVG